MVALTSLRSRHARRLGIGAEHATHVVAGDVGEHEVEHDGVGLPAPYRLKRFAPRGGLTRLKAGLLQLVFYKLTKDCLVVYDENPSCNGDFSLSRWLSSAGASSATTPPRAAMIRVPVPKAI